MQLSETVVAAMIGAVATMSTAIFQLYSALRTRGKLEVRPKRGRTVRSIVAVIALMAASGVGGYVYAELRRQHAADDIRSLREELNAKLQVLAATTERLAAREVAMSQSVVALRPTSDTTGNVESVVFAPACLGGNCNENTAQRLTLCGAMPNAMQVRKVELFAKPAGATAAWDQAPANFEQDVGGGKFIGPPSEHPQDETNKAVCVDFMHWSAEPHLARVVLQYGASAAQEPALEQSTPAAVAASPAMPTAHVASMSQSTSAQ